MSSLKNTDLYKGINVRRNQSGFFYVRNEDIPNNITYRKRFASRVLGRYLGENSESIYGDIIIDKLKNGAKIYAV